MLTHLQPKKTAGVDPLAIDSQLPPSLATSAAREPRVVFEILRLATECAPPIE